MDMKQKLNKLQYEVANELKRHILLTASAGTGKTNTLSHRIGNIIASNKAKGEEILCLTFTNKACNEMKDRISSLVGEAGNGVTIRTFHSFCFDIIRSEAKKRTDISWDFVIFDDVDEQLFLTEVVNELNDTFAENYAFNEIKWPNMIFQGIVEMAKIKRAELNIYSGDEEADYSQAIEYIYQNEKEALKNKCYDKGHILENIPREFHRYGARIITEYDRKLKENHGCDFTDLIVNAYQLLQDKTVSDVWSAKYKYINVDEMQDTSKLEYTILEKIFGNSCILLCGDFFQTIFQWRGSEPDKIIKNFQEDYQPKKVVFLENYRSTQLLVNASFETLSYLFPENTKMYYPEGISAVSKTAGDKIIQYEAANVNTQARWIYRQIYKMYLEHGEDILQKVCILTRTNFYNKDLSDRMEKIGDEYQARNDYKIPFMLVDDFKFFRRQEIKDTVAFLRLLINKHDIGSLKRIIKRFVKGIGKASLDAINSETYHKAGIKLTDFIDPVCHKYGDPYELLEKQLATENVIVFDVEATGIETEKDEIIQIAAIRLDKNGRMKEKFVRFLKAGKSVGTSEKVHGFSDEYLAENGIEPAKALKDFCEFAKDSVIVGHNVTFDITIMTSQLRRLKMPSAQFMGVYDTLDIFRRFYPKLKNHKLEYLGEYCKVNHKSSHDAFDDIMATAEILMYALEKDIRPTAGERRQYISNHLGKFTDLTEKLTELKNKIENNAISLKDLITFVMMDLGIVEYYNSNNEDDNQENKGKRIENLRQLFRHVRNFEGKYSSRREDLEKFLQLASLSNTEIDLQLKEKPQIPILTVHQVKGSEFDYVFIADMLDGVFPNGIAYQQKTLEEEKRLFYVAITRAKKKLYLIYPVWGRKKSPSPYLKAIPDKFKHIET